MQRKALERVAAELPFDVADLSDATREIAWSPETPEEDEVEAISEKAGVARASARRRPTSERNDAQAHRRNASSRICRRSRSHAERTTLVRAALALALTAALGGAVLLARSAGSGRAAVLPVGAKTGVIVIDMSASVAGPKFERIANVIRGLSTADQGVGLVMFSDTAYELLPPNSPTSALLQFERFFTPLSIYHGTPEFGTTAWDTFSGGTRISSGLKTGLDALRRAHVTHGSLLLISDLNDAVGGRRRRSRAARRTSNGPHPGADRPGRRGARQRADLQVAVRPERFHLADGVQVVDEHGSSSRGRVVAVGADRGRGRRRRATRRE